MKKFICGAVLLAVACSKNDDSDTSTAAATDITDQTFTSRSADCSTYAGSFSSSVTDVNNNASFSGTVVIAATSSGCSLTSNSIPNHDFNDGSSSFASDISAVSASYSIPSPALASSTTALSMGQTNVILLNGVKVDILPAACYGVGDEPLGQEKIGCTDLSYAWRYDPMYSGNNFGTDTHNAHGQPPSGLYHYHGDPKAIYDTSSPNSESGLIGFAADGYPLYGPYIDDNGTVRAVTSSYKLREGTRSLSDLDSSLQEGASPGGSYDGTYRDDYVYEEGAGDLDECNGMTRDGQYGYYVTSTFPWIVNCFKGTPDSSFNGGG